MTLAADLIPVVDSARSLIQDLGFRTKAVAVRVTTRAGSGLGAIGTQTHSDLELDPWPRVRRVTSVESRNAGLYEVGDYIIDRISATYTEAQLRKTSGEWCWRVDGDDCKLITLDYRPLGWYAVVRRTLR